MAQGLPAVDWKKPENTAKLFAAVLALIPGTPDYKKIAAVFGPSVPANAIAYRLSVVRKEGAAMGLVASPGSFSKKARKITTHAAPAAKKSNAKKNPRKRGETIDDDTSDDQDTAMDSEEEESAARNDGGKTPIKRQKTIGGRVTKRVSPRKDRKINYKKLDDPFVSIDSAEEEDGNNVVGEPSNTESEDTYATDGSYTEADKKVTVKTEEAV